MGSIPRKVRILLVLDTEEMCMDRVGQILAGGIWRGNMSNEDTSMSVTSKGSECKLYSQIRYTVCPQ